MREGDRNLRRNLRLRLFDQLFMWNWVFSWSFLPSYSDPRLRAKVSAAIPSSISKNPFTTSLTQRKRPIASFDGDKLYTLDENVEVRSRLRCCIMTWIRSRFHVGLSSGSRRVSISELAPSKFTAISLVKASSRMNTPLIEELTSTPL